jgi:hypothetical protein
MESAVGSTDPALTQLNGGLIDCRRQLGRLVLAAPPRDPAHASARREELDRLARLKEQLERELSRRSPGVGENDPREPGRRDLPCAPGCPPGSRNRSLPCATVCDGRSDGGRRPDPEQGSPEGPTRQRPRVRGRARLRRSGDRFTPRGPRATPKSWERGAAGRRPRLGTRRRPCARGRSPLRSPGRDRGGGEGHRGRLRGPRRGGGQVVRQGARRGRGHQGGTGRDRGRSPIRARGDARLLGPGRCPEHLRHLGDHAARWPARGKARSRRAQPAGLRGAGALGGQPGRPGDPLGGGGGDAAACWSGPGDDLGVRDGAGRGQGVARACWDSGARSLRPARSRW